MPKLQAFALPAALADQLVSAADPIMIRLELGCAEGDVCSTLTGLQKADTKTQLLPQQPVRPVRQLGRQRWQTSACKDDDATS